MSNDPLFTVAGQVVLVSGGSRGIGHALAGGFVERGAQVIIAGRERETLEAAAEQLSTGEHPVRALVCDVARPEAVVGAVQRRAAQSDGEPGGRRRDPRGRPRRPGH